MADSPEAPDALAQLMGLATQHGFTFTPAGESGALWGERVTEQWQDLLFLDASGPCNAVRSRRGQLGPGEPLFVDRVSGTELTVLQTVIYDWPT